MTTGIPFRSSHLYFVNADGSGLRQITRGRGYFDECSAWSPDGKRIAFSSSRNPAVQPSIWVTNLQTGALTRVTQVSRSHADETPVWSPDGRKIAFGRCQAGSAHGPCVIWVKNLLTGQLNRVTSNRYLSTSPAWSPNGKWLAFSSMRDRTWHIFIVGANGGGPAQLTRSRAPDENPSWSPDGKWIAFERHNNGAFDIYLRAVPGRGLTRVTRTPPNKATAEPDWGRR
jgi:TolB protein